MTLILLSWIALRCTFFLLSIFTVIPFFLLLHASLFPFHVWTGLNSTFTFHELLTWRGMLFLFHIIPSPRSILVCFSFLTASCTTSWRWPLAASVHFSPLQFVWWQPWRLTSCSCCFWYFGLFTSCRYPSRAAGQSKLRRSLAAPLCYPAIRIVNGICREATLLLPICTGLWKCNF